MTTKSYPKSRLEVFRPSITEQEIDAVASVLRSGWIGAGPKVEEFEQAWARHIGVARECVVSVGCATEALFQVMHEVFSWYGVRHVVAPDNSFIGTAAAVLDNGLELHLCDIDRHILNPGLDDYSEHMGPGRAIVYQHYGGFSGLGYAGALNELCDLWDAPLIEDMACHPMGRPVGDFAVWSFDAMKIMTCGDGGIVYCKDAQAAQSIREATRLGMDTASGQSSDAPNWWEFTAHVPGRRSMMNDIGAAIGLVQLRKLPQMVARRESIWNTYQSQLPDADWLIKPPQPAEGGSFYTYWIQMYEQTKRDLLAAYLRELGVYTTFRYWPIHRAYGWDVNCPNSDWAADHTLNLPLHPGLTDSDVEYVCDTIAEFGRTL